ncbi:MAG: hypothetical protein ABIW31_01975 [Novosphingobium sp.]
MTKSNILASATLLAPLVLSMAACNKQTDKQVQAGGAILPGSASDAMLPLDTVTSQPPLAPKIDKAPIKGKAGAAGAAPDVAAPVAPATDAPPG